MLNNARFRDVVFAHEMTGKRRGIFDRLFKVAVLIYANFDTDRIFVIIAIPCMPTLLIVIKRLYDLFIVNRVMPRSRATVSACLESCMSVSVCAGSSVRCFVDDN